MFGLPIEVAIAGIGFVLLAAFLVKGWADFQEWTVYTSRIVTADKVTQSQAVLCGLLAIAEAILLGLAIHGTYWLMSTIFEAVSQHHDKPFCLFACG